MSYDQQKTGAAPQAPAYYPAPYQQPAKDPGKTLGIVGFILAFLFALVGLILCIVALNKSKKAGFSNGLAVAGIVIAPIMMILGAASRIS